MGGGSLDEYHENMGMESNSVPTSSDSTAESAGDSILQQLMQLCLSEEPLSTKTGHANGGDWQEEVYQKIKTIKETYLPELDQLYQKIVTKLQQHESLPQQPKSDQLDKLKIIKTMLERNISFLQVSKTNVLPTAPLQQEQLPQFHMQAMPQQKSQISQVQSHENPMQSMDMQGPLPMMQQNNMSSIGQVLAQAQAQSNMLSMTLAQAQNNMSSMAQLNSVSSLSLSGVSASQQNINPLQHPGSNLYAAQGNAINSLQQNFVSISQQSNVNMLQSQQLNQQLQDLRVQQRELMQKQNQITQSQLQSMRLQQISQIMTKTEPQNPLTFNSNGGDWRSQMQAGSREKIVNKILETLKRQLSLYAQEDLQRMATGYEENFYSAALSQSDYLRAISLKMLTIERYSPRMPLSYRRAYRFSVPGASLDSTAAQLGLSNGGDWKEEVYRKIKTMRKTYLPELNQMLQEIVTKLQQPMSDEVDKLKTLKTMLERLVSVLQVSKTKILPENKQWLGLYEWRIIYLLAIKPDLLTNSRILQQIAPFLAIQPDLAEAHLIGLSSAKRSRERELKEEVKKQKIEIQKLKQMLVQQVKEEKK